MVSKPSSFHYIFRDSLIHKCQVITAYTSACKVQFVPMYPYKYLKIRSILCCVLSYVVLVLICPCTDRFENLLAPVVYYSWLKFLKGSFHDCNCHPMKIWQIIINYTWTLETFRIVCQNEIYAVWIFSISIASWFLNKTFKVSSPPEVFYKKGVLGNFTKFTGKTPVPESFLHKVAGLMLLEVICITENRHITIIHAYIEIT